MIIIEKRLTGMRNDQLGSKAVTSRLNEIANEFLDVFFKKKKKKIRPLK